MAQPTDSDTPLAMASAANSQPPLPPRHEEQQLMPTANPHDLNQQTNATPPQPHTDHTSLEHHDPSSPIYYARDPKKLIAYLVPFPKPHLFSIPPDRIPQRFLIYTPPPPPLHTPAAGEKEGKVHKLQRKWQEEVREAKTQHVKTASWKGVKGKATKAISWGIEHVTSSNLDFVNRIESNGKDVEERHPSHDTKDDVETKTPKLEEMLFLHPISMKGTNEELRDEFVDTMLRTKSKAKKDAIIATGLLPVSEAFDLLATFVWPFGGLMEIDAVWLVSSFQGYRASRNVARRLESSATSEDPNHEDTLRLNFTASPQLEVLSRYLAAECHRVDNTHFRSPGTVPTETEVLEAIAWTPSHAGAEDRNWEDDAWETQQVKEDLKVVMSKASKEWDKWCKLFEKSPEKAMKK